MNTKKALSYFILMSLAGGGTSFAAEKFDKEGLNSAQSQNSSEPVLNKSQSEAPIAGSSRRQRPLAISVRFGANMSSGKLEETVSLPGLPPSMGVTLEGTSRTGLAVNAGIEVPLTSVLSFQPELAIAQKGFSYEASLNNSRTLNFTYLELPLLLKVKATTRVVQPFMVLGGSVGYLLSQTYTYNYLGKTGGGSFLSDDFNHFEATAIGGAGLEIVLNKKVSIVAEGRYSRGLTNVMRKSFGNDAKMQFHSIQALGGIQVSL